MQNGIMGRAFGWSALLLGLIQIQCLLIPDDATTERVSNRRPSVRITAGAATSDTTGINYKVRFRWNGFDEDGVVARFQYAIDDTVTEDAWTDTTGFGAQIRFRATVQDAAADTSFTDWHTFYIRAIDNEFARSEADFRFFNARTIAPRSQITFPILTDDLVPQLPRTLVIQWDGDDLDSSDSDEKPVAYQLKLVRAAKSFDDIEILVDSLTNANNLFLDTLQVGDKRRWIEQPADKRQIIIRDLPVNSTFAFGLRAVDEAGAVEPVFERNRNVLGFDVSPIRVGPWITASDPTFGEHDFSTQGRVWDISVPPNRPLRFSWTGDASYYGSMAGNSNYALDIADVEDESLTDPAGIGGWIGWAKWEGIQQPIVFSEEDGGTTHDLWIKMRDISGDEESESIARIRMYVVPFTFEKFAVVMDESRFQTSTPTDAEHDMFIDNFVARRLFDLGTVDHLPMYGPVGGDETRPSENVYDLRVYAQYQHTLWHLSYLGSEPQAIYANEVQSDRKRLSTYSSAGGRMFLIGGRIAGYLTGRSSGGGHFGYPKVPPYPGAELPSFSEDSFLWSFMRYRNEIVSSRESPPQAHQASGLVGVRSLHPAYPDIPLDTSKWDPYAVINEGTQLRGGISDWEAVQGNYRPIHKMEGLDSLYAPVTFDTTLCCGPVAIDYSDAVIAQRYESTRQDTVQSTQQGRIVVFDFAPWFMQSQPLLDASTTAVNWLVTGRDH